MSNIDKEWLQQKIADMEAARDEIPFGLGEDDSNTLAALRIALASLEAEPVCVIDQSNLDYLKSGSDADVWPAYRTEMGDVLLYRSAPPAPVSVPTFEEWCELTEQKPVGWVRDAMKEAYDGCRDAMLQGAEPDFREIVNSSTNNCRENAETSTKCWCHTCRPVTFSDSRLVVCPECGNKRCPHANDHRHACTGSNEPGQEGSAYPPAPQQEVKP
ncbi:hypothetical protein [Enterobacter cloacae]|uniref:hypothetical protein n=1 Tax=Enterobacter cloacae TaxID=550 RepID=UPI000C9BED67|nr:hypothetical protein [Enterobacter cloacae]PNC14565.1 hypothetical protein CK475_24635 [Enterobacter cloacae]